MLRNIYLYFCISSLNAGFLQLRDCNSPDEKERCVNMVRFVVYDFVQWQW